MDSNQFLEIHRNCTEFIDFWEFPEIPPHPGAGIAIRGYTWVSGWYPAATELMILKKAYSSQKNSLVFMRF